MMELNLTALIDVSFRECEGHGSKFVVFTTFRLLQEQAFFWSVN